MAGEDQQERRQAGQDDLDADEARQVEPVGMAGLHELDLQAVDQRLGQEPAGGLAEPAKDRGRLGGAALRVAPTRRRGWRALPTVGP